MKPQVLVADDDKMDRVMLRKILEESGFSVLEAGSGNEAIKKTRSSLPALLILDLNLGDFSGMDVCAAIKNDGHISQIPILVLTGDPESGLNISCLDQGADDYMTKPFDRLELAARVRAILRRVTYAGSRQDVLKRDGISLDVGQHVAILNDRKIENLTPKEFDLLHLLLKNSPNVVSRELVARKVWDIDMDVFNERTIDVHMRRIRLKLGPEALNRLVTVTGKGYKFV